MIELNADELCLEIKKKLTFANTVFPVWKECQEQEKRLQNYELTQKDKIRLLGYVQDVYEKQQFDVGACDIFDYEIIRDAVMEWIEDNFEK